MKVSGRGSIVNVGTTLKNVTQKTAGTRSQISTTVGVQLLRPDAILPARANSTDAGWDLSLPQNMRDHTLMMGRSVRFPLGLAWHIPEGWEVEIRGRSGLACRGIFAHVGTIDHLYRQEISVILFSIDAPPYRFEGGERIAQAIPRPISPCPFVQVDCVPQTERGGFGSTGRI